ncbi:MAG: iron export ABC transporter permease subunit FetB [Nitrospinaceae bacterium]|nr:MAG: iron export ABC transporter permease subunit FetB [Nitrospinaceae bacterium]
MENESLLLSYGLVIAAVLISYYNHLKIEREMVVSSIRATLQLIVVGFLLDAILKIEQPLFLFLILLFMSGVAGVISGNRGKEIPHSHGIAILGIAMGSLLTFGLLYGAGVIQPEARYAIPLGGMIIGNSMKASSLAMDRLISELGHQRRRVETLLALGANARQAASGSVGVAVKAAMMPTVDTMKTVGLVHLPGIMTGFIIAGGSPITAVKYQLAVMYMLAGATGITCLLVTLMAYHQCFTRDLQLMERFRPAH